MKILFLCNKDYWMHKMSRVRFHGIDAIARHPEVSLVKDGPGFDGFTDCVSSENKHKPDIVVWYKPMGMPRYNEVKALKCLRFNEMWWVDIAADEINKTKTDIIISHQENDIKNFKGKCPKAKFYHIPHCIEKTIFKDYNLPKEYDVIFVGINSPTIYPLRGKFYNILQNSNLKYKTKIIEHPGYSIDDVDKQVIEYAKTLNKAKIVVSCSSKYQYLLAKYTEIVACKSLLLADVPDQSKPFIRKFIAEVDPNDSEAVLMNKIGWWIENEKERIRRVELGYSLIHSGYTQEHYAQNFINVVKKYL